MGQAMFGSVQRAQQKFAVLSAPVLLASARQQPGLRKEATSSTERVSARELTRRRADRNCAHRKSTLTQIRDRYSGLLRCALQSRKARNPAACSSKAAHMKDRGFSNFHYYRCVPCFPLAVCSLFFNGPGGYYSYVSPSFKPTPSASFDLHHTPLMTGGCVHSNFFTISHAA